MLAYHGSETLKQETVATVLQMLGEEEFMDDGIGRLSNQDNFKDAASVLGIPAPLLHLHAQLMVLNEPDYFENVQIGRYKYKPEKFYSAPKPGADLSTVHLRLMHWILTDLLRETTKHVKILKIVQEIAGLLTDFIKGNGDAKAMKIAAAAVAYRAKSNYCDASSNYALAACYAAESAIDGIDRLVYDSAVANLREAKEKEKQDSLFYGAAVAQAENAASKSVRLKYAADDMVAAAARLVSSSTNARVVAQEYLYASDGSADAARAVEAAGHAVSRSIHSHDEMEIAEAYEKIGEKLIELMEAAQ